MRTKWQKMQKEDILSWQLKLIVIKKISQCSKTSPFVRRVAKKCELCEEASRNQGQQHNGTRCQMPSFPIHKTERVEWLPNLCSQTPKPESNKAPNQQLSQHLEIAESSSIQEMKLLRQISQMKLQQWGWVILHPEMRDQINAGMCSSYWVYALRFLFFCLPQSTINYNNFFNFIYFNLFILIQSWGAPSKGGFFLPFWQDLGCTFLKRWWKTWNGLFWPIMCGYTCQNAKKICQWKFKPVQNTPHFTPNEDHPKGPLLHFGPWG